jgi:hypothetical protein
MTAPPTVEDLIAAVMATAAGIDTEIRHLSVKLDAASVAAESVEALRLEVQHLRHEMRSLRTAIGVVNDVQDQVVDDRGPRGPKAAA